MSGAPTTSRELAPAKLNLYLDVHGQRDDGFHDIETVFAALDFGDDVAVCRTDARAGIVLVVAGASANVPTDASNLAVRAARAFLDAADASVGVEIHLEKRVPPGQGLGGGSSDAASVLGQLDGLFPGAVSRERLFEIATELGSDVPFFVAAFGGDALAVGRGRGERLEALPPCRVFEAVLVLPPVLAATAVVYRNLGARFRGAPTNGLEAVVSALASGDPVRLREAHYNALAVPAIGAYPALARFTSNVERRLGRPPCLTGSGAALFDLPEPGETERVLAVLEGLEGTRRVVRFGSDAL